MANSSEWYKNHNRTRSNMERYIEDEKEIKKKLDETVANRENELKELKDWTRNENTPDNRVDYKITVWNKYASLTDIYAERMAFLVKKNYEWKDPNHLINKRYDFVLNHDNNAIADLIKWFFEAKRRYTRDKTNNEPQEWFSLCRIYCDKYKRQEPETIVHSFFSSYSAAEERICKKMKGWTVLVNTSDSIFDVLQVVKAEAEKKQQEKAEKLAEKERLIAEKLAEKERKKAERERLRAEKLAEKERKKAERERLKAGKTTKAKKITEGTSKEDIENDNIIDEWALNHYGWNDYNIVNEEWDVVPNEPKLSFPDTSIATDDSFTTTAKQKNRHSTVPTPQRTKKIKEDPNNLKLFDDDWNPTKEALTNDN